ncbi:phosphoribosylformylglycinamidine synthase-associated small membrane protein [Polymorphum gilvum]
MDDDTARAIRFLAVKAAVFIVLPAVVSVIAVLVLL